MNARGATARRFRPIALTAAAAVLAPITRVHSDFVGPMAVAMMSSIVLATALTLAFLRAAYVTWRCAQPALRPGGAVPAAAAP